MSSPIFDLNCPFCDRVYKLPREKVVKHVGKTIFCRQCGQPFSVPPLPSFESNAGIIAVPSENQVHSAAVDESTSVAVEAPPAPSAHEDDEYTEHHHAPAEEQSEETDTGEAYTAYEKLDESAPTESHLPGPFSADPLPPVSDVFAAADEPPTVNLSADVSHVPLDQVEPAPYLASNEHGAIAVSEESTATFSDSFQGSATLMDIPITSDTDEDEEAIAEREAFEETIRSEVAIPSPQPIPNPAPPPPPPQKKRPNTPVRVALPPGLSLDDVPVARVVDPPRAPTVPPVDLTPIRKKLATLTTLCVIILLLLLVVIGIQAAELLGYLPLHHG